MLKSGKIVAVCTSPVRGVPKYQRPSVVVGPYGLVGDAHASRTRVSFKTGQTKFNDRHITLVAQEVLDRLNAELGLNLKPGDLGENFTTVGLGDLSVVKDGTRIQLGSNVVLRVTKQNDPCKNLLTYHPQLLKKVYGQRGLLCTVHEGVGSLVHPGDTVEIS